MLDSLIEKIIAAILAFFAKKAADEIAVAKRDEKIDQAGDTAVATKDTTDLENSLDR